MTKKLLWRLSKLPTPDELRELVKDKIITQEEARDILVSEETEDTRDKKDLQSEIKFLRELVEKLSVSKSTIVKTIREIAVPYYQYKFYEPYRVWMSEPTITYSTSGNSMNAIDTASTSTLIPTQSFSQIKTF